MQLWPIPALQITALPTIPSVINSREQLLLLPLLTSARHNSSCEHSYSIAECPDSIQRADSTDKGASTKCFFWTAGSDLPAGTEVCTSYGQLRPDQALLQYGLSLEALYRLQPDRRPDKSQVRQCSLDVQQGMQSGQQCASAEATSSQPVPLSGMDTVDSTDYVPFGPVSFQQLVPAKHGGFWVLLAAHVVRECVTEAVDSHQHAWPSWMHQRKLPAGSKSEQSFACLQTNSKAQEYLH